MGRPTAIVLGAAGGGGYPQWNCRCPVCQLAWAGDPRANFYKGVGLELSTATHAEARLIAQAACDGDATRGAVLYVTDFPCPPCAKLIAAAGIERLYYREGYAVLDGQDVLEGAGVEIVRVAAGDTVTPASSR